MTVCDDEQNLIRQGLYAKKLRPLLPERAFIPDKNKLTIQLINVVILLLGWGIASYLDEWSTYLLWLYLPLALVMGNSIVVLLFSSHELMHNSVIKNYRLIYFFGFLGMIMLGMPPTFWKVVHNREHHNKTNSLDDPDRNYLSTQPNTWGKWIQDRFVPSAEVHPLGLLLGMTSAWAVHNFRNLTSVLLFNSKSVSYVPAAFRISTKERRLIAVEWLAIVAIHGSILAYLQFHPLKVVLVLLFPDCHWLCRVNVLYLYKSHDL